MSAKYMAQRLGWASSTVSRLESGERQGVLTNLATYLTLCDVLGSDQAALLDLARARDDERWSTPHGDRLPDESPALRYQQTHANRIICYHPGSLPELLQTEEIAAQQLQVQMDTAARLPDLLVDRVAGRMARQHILTYTDRSWLFYLDEATLRTLPGEQPVRSGQLMALAMLTGAQVRIRVVPAHVAQTGLAVGRFWLFGFAAHHPVVCAQTDTISVFAEREHDLIAYQRILDRLDALSFSEHASVDMIMRLAECEPQPPRRAASTEPESLAAHSRP